MPFGRRGRPPDVCMSSSVVSWNGCFAGGGFVVQRASAPRRNRRSLNFRTEADARGSTRESPARAKAPDWSFPAESPTVSCAVEGRCSGPSVAATGRWVQGATGTRGAGRAAGPVAGTGPGIGADLGPRDGPAGRGGGDRDAGEPGEAGEVGGGGSSTGMVTPRAAVTGNPRRCHSLIPSSRISAR